MWWWPLIGSAIVILIVAYLFPRRVVFWEPWVAILCLVAVISGANWIMYRLYYMSKTADTEVWSGQVTDWSHREEWDEWHPPQEHQSCSTDSKGNQSCTTWTTPGYWEHHYATNSVKTSENGWFYVSKIPTSQAFYCPDLVGRALNDSWPNDVSVLQQCWPKGSPTASTHTYENKVQASYSVFRHQNVDLKDYPFLPEYPKKVHDHIWVDRLIDAGVGWDKAAFDQAQLALAEENARLGKPKQVNMIVVLLPGDRPSSTAWALQDYWEGGNKNDFVLVIGVQSDGTITWADAFSWSEIEELKIEVRNLVLDAKRITDLELIIRQMASLVESKFVRKQMADYAYLQIEYPIGILIADWILAAIATAIACVWMLNNDDADLFIQRRRYNRYRYY